MLKIGDKVKIRSDLNANKHYGDVVFVGEMEKYCGKVLTIKYVNYVEDRIEYQMEEDYRWDWTDEMFEPLTEEDKKNILMNISTIKTGVVIITKYDRIGIVVNGFVWHYDGSIDAVENILTYIQEYEDNDYIKYIIKCKYGFKHIQNNLTNIKADKPVTGIEILWKYEEPIPEVTMEEVYKKFGHKVKIVPEK